MHKFCNNFSIQVQIAKKLNICKKILQTKKSRKKREPSHISFTRSPILAFSCETPKKSNSAPNYNFLELIFKKHANFFSFKSFKSQNNEKNWHPSATIKKSWRIKIVWFKKKWWTIFRGGHLRLFKATNPAEQIIYNEIDFAFPKIFFGPVYFSIKKMQVFFQKKMCCPQLCGKKSGLRMGLV